MSTILELFRANHCHEQINEKQRRDNSDDGRFHFAPLELLAKTRVHCARDKKRNDGSDKDEIAHKISLTMSEV
jgi:hypothetical protein